MIFSKDYTTQTQLPRVMMIQMILRKGERQVQVAKDQDIEANIDLYLSHLLILK